VARRARGRLVGVRHGATLVKDGIAGAATKIVDRHEIDLRWAA
jgi:hypothetical protein